MPVEMELKNPLPNMISLIELKTVENALGALEQHQSAADFVSAFSLRQKPFAAHCYHNARVLIGIYGSISEALYNVRIKMEVIGGTE